MCRRRKTGGNQAYLSEVVDAMIGMGDDPVRSRRVVTVEVWMCVLVDRIQTMEHMVRLWDESVQEA